MKLRGGAQDHGIGKCLIASGVLSCLYCRPPLQYTRWDGCEGGCQRWRMGEASQGSGCVHVCGETPSLRREAEILQERERGIQATLLTGRDAMTYSHC